MVAISDVLVKPGFYVEVELGGLEGCRLCEGVFLDERLTCVRVQTPKRKKELRTELGEAERQLGRAVGGNGSTKEVFKVLTGGTKSSNLWLERCA